MINSHHTQRGVCVCVCVGGGPLPSRIACCIGVGRVGSGGHPWRELRLRSPRDPLEHSGRASPAFQAGVSFRCHTDIVHDQVQLI